MLKLASDFDTTTRIHLLLQGRCAADPESGFYLIRSSGRRMGGRPTRYHLCHADVDRSRRISAFSDAEAVEKANQYLAKRGG